MNCNDDVGDSKAGADVAAATAGPLAYLPVSLFGSVMGLTGLSVAWRLAHTLYGAPESISFWIGAIALVAFVLLASGYIVKLVGSPAAVEAEFVHPIAGNLFGTMLISLLLLPIVLAPISLVLARCLWMAGALGMLVFAWTMLDRWMSARQQTANASPAWIVPVVGMLDIPLALPSLHMAHMRGPMILGLAVGLFFAIPIFTIVFARLLFETPLPNALQPTLMILLAPFAVGTSSYIAATGAVDMFALSLYALTLFMLAVLAGRLRYLSRCCPFRVSWWAVSFPLAAAAISALRIAESADGWLPDAIAMVLLAAASLLTAWLLSRSVIGIARGELRTLSG